VVKPGEIRSNFAMVETVINVIGGGGAILGASSEFAGWSSPTSMAITNRPESRKLVEIRSVIGWMISGTESTLYRVTTQQVPRKLIQTRVLTNCPLCGFRQRLERLTGGEYHVTDLGDLLPLEVAAIYAEKRAHGLVCEFRDLRLKPGQRQAMLEALAAKMLPLVRLLSVEVPEFCEALEAEEFTITLRAMPLKDSLLLKNLPMPLEDSLPLKLPMPLKIPMSRDVPESWLEVNEWQTEKSPMSLTTEMPLELSMTGVPKVVKHHRQGST